MRSEGGVTTGRWMRLVLLFCTLVGLAAMHTLGHGAHASGTHATGMHASRTPASGARPVEHLAGMAADLTADGLSGHVVDLAAGVVPLAPSGGDPVGWSVCLAVLGGFALVLLVVVLLRRRGVGLPSAPGSPGVSGPRAPPPRPVGLRLATASVLRR
ncbi:hypothetical protein ACFO0M_21070 [Micromonospora mangrovi]|uniref:Uncharacterized protein n=2 Tax=Micromonospora TaxID=1873 RepID=A0AAU7M461_9ACTN